ncbi:hypothetical protein BGV64_25975 [Burkholderia ubonensis]|nr:hypothetical protein BGV64_25975 [Burkholderia ubonensis]
MAEGRRPRAYNGRARRQWGRRMRHDATKKTIFCMLAAALVCAACAQGGASAADERGSHIEMYGVIDQGVTVRR